MQLSKKGQMCYKFMLILSHWNSSWIHLRECKCLRYSQWMLFDINDCGIIRISAGNLQKTWEHFYIKTGSVEVPRHYIHTKGYLQFYCWPSQNTGVPPQSLCQISIITVLDLKRLNQSCIGKSTKGINGKKIDLKHTNRRKTKK